MIPQTQATLKSYFETGDKPTEAQFGELIDTFFYLAQEALTAAEAAETAAENAEDIVDANTAKVLLRSASSASGGTWSKAKSAGVDTVVFTGGKVRVNFTTDFADANYIVTASITGVVLSSSTPLIIQAINATTGYVEFTLNGLAANGSQLHLAIFNPE